MIKKWSGSKCLVFGIYGPFGAGKSTLRIFFESRGFPCLDVDDVVHALYEPGKSGSRLIRQFFGKEYLHPDGSVDRSRLSDLVFFNPEKLKLLHSIIHPVLTCEVKKWLISHKKESPNALFIESFYFDPDYLGSFLDDLILVQASKKLCFERIQKSFHMKRSKFDVMWSLLPSYKPDFILNNNSSRKNFLRSAQALLKQLKI